MALNFNRRWKKENDVMNYSVMLQAEVRVSADSPEEAVEAAKAIEFNDWWRKEIFTRKEEDDR
jgi:hypothetical protein